TAVRRFAAVLFALSLPLALLFELIILRLSPFIESLNILPRDFDYTGWYIFAGALLTINAMGVLCLFVDNRRVRNITDYIHNFLKESKD
ncbi:MAG: hypothetical protein FWG45_02050, partial [Oscillospiraceae bacterium]|nr:hypothetical protein [Oscillospiraceae bacterium]